MGQTKCLKNWNNSISQIPKEDVKRCTSIEIIHKTKKKTSKNRGKKWEQNHENQTEYRHIVRYGKTGFSVYSQISQL